MSRLSGPRPELRIVSLRGARWLLRSLLFFALALVFVLLLFLFLLLNFFPGVLALVFPGRAALLHALTSFLLFHTHPSGEPDPSLEDLTFTRRLKEACEAVGVRMLDHLIVGSPTRWVSLKDRYGW